MRTKRSFCFLLLLLCASLPSGFGAGRQGRAEETARLFARYEQGAGYNRLSEEMLTLTLSVSSRERATVAIRVCSKEPTPFALATAGADPFRVANFLTHSYAYPPQRVVYLRAEDCLSPTDPAVTEVWAVPQGSPLPPHVEAFTSDQVRLTPLGRVRANRGVRDYRAALRQLIRDLRANPAAVGVVFGYFLERPSPALRGRLREVERTLERSGLAHERYLVRLKAWDDEVSTYPPDSEPKYPSLFVVEIAPEKARRWAVLQELR